MHINFRISGICLLLLLSILIMFGCSGNNNKLSYTPTDLKKAKKEELPEKKIVETNPLIELDGKTKAEVYEIRTNYVNQHPELISALYTGKYKPNEDVFGQITDGKTWWGILGLFYYGRGEKSIEGPSEETRFLANPYLLVGLGESVYRVVRDSSLEIKAVYARPVELTWDLKNSTVSVKYDLDSFFSEGAKYRYINMRDFVLVSYNARDLGFPYLYIDPDKTTGIKFQKQNEALAIPHFIHTGGSSGYPGGSNNMSPGCPPLDITVESLPARTVIKLWRNKPESVSSDPDLWYIIDMK